MISRMNAAASLVHPCFRFIDIGSDHALLPISLLKSGIVQLAIATDVRKGPLERSKSAAAIKGLSDKFTFILSNGFDNVAIGSFDCAAICGMGGSLISEIIDKAGEKVKNVELVLQPMTSAEELRKYLWDNGFIIDSELFAYEQNKPYCIIRTFFCNEKTDYTYTDLFLGKFRPQTEEYNYYKQKIKNAAEKRRIGYISRNDDLTEIDELIKACD